VNRTVIVALCLIVAAAPRAAFALIDVPVTPAPAADITEHDLVAYVDAYAPRIAAITSARDVAAADVLDAKKIPNPELEYQNVSKVDGVNVNGEVAHSVTLGMPLLLFGQRHSRIQAALARQTATNADIASAKLELEHAARRAFVALLAAQERVGAWDESVRDSERVEKIVAGRVEAGKKSQYDLERIQLEAASDRRALGDALADEDAAAGQLAAIVGVASWKPRAIGQLRPHGVDTDVGKLWAHALETLPALQAGKLKHQADVAEIDVARREGWPVPQLQVGEQSTSDPHSLSVVAGVTMPLPVFDRNQGEIARKRAEAQTSALEFDATMREARTALETAVAVLVRKRETLASFERDAVARVPRLRQMADAFYQSGEGNLVDLLDALKAINEARLNQIELVADVVPAELDVEFAAGLDVRPDEVAAATPDIPGPKPAATSSAGTGKSNR